MASTLELYVDGSNWYARTAVFVASCVNLLNTKVMLNVKGPTDGDTTTGNRVGDGDSPVKLFLGDGTAISQMNTILEYFVKAAGHAESLFGTNPEERAQVSQWLQYVSSNKDTLYHCITEINIVLQTRTFLVGDRITLADLVLFWCFHPLLEAVPAAKWGTGGAPKSLGRHYRSVAASSFVSRAKSAPPALSFGVTYAPPPEGTFNGEFAAAAKAAAAKATAAATAKKEDAGAAAKGGNAKQGKKKEKKKKEKKKAAPKAAPGSDQSPFTKIAIRVGKITNVWHHEDSEKLFCEEIDIGEEKVRSVASGLRHYYKLEDLQDRMVIMVCNLKPAKLGGFPSAGMVLCSKDGDKCEFVDPPATAKVGDRLMIDGITGDAETNVNKVKKKKMWEAVANELKTNGDGVVCWEGKPLKTPSGDVCTCPSEKNMPVS